ncbi:MAG: hypothetical protein WAK53_14445 [Chromatiaceae bacterium]
MGYRRGRRVAPHPNNRKRRVYSKLFLARLLLVLHSCGEHLTPLLENIEEVDQWVASDHDELLP